MAGSLPNILLKRFAARSLSRPLSGSFYNYGLRFSTNVPEDPDTHDDFKPTNKLENSGISLANIVEQDVKDNPVMLYMKGVPDFPQCGFSSLAVRVLQQYDVPISARNILEDPDLKSAVKAFSQLLIKKFQQTTVCCHGEF
ncbi:monothiol glutaredoxin-S15, mitochondrial [Senna tora]|uniref:Monothiol glutaredoxin-S15, mitochondrial n=1 Tax=Senna tora TaxID=362788 RepID=A0A834T237_9FABA|nr:monothiol glutaredoxin-S15, mitochondrial [Senna tora]